MNKGLWMACHEEIMHEMMEQDPSMSWDRAYATAANFTHTRYLDRLDHMADVLRAEKKAP